MEGHLTAVANGEVEVEAGVLVLRRIHVVFTLKDTAQEQVEAAQRAHEVFKQSARCIARCIAPSTSPPS